MDPIESTDFRAESEDDLGEYERVGALVARKNALFSEAARKGYEAHGRGAVFYCEASETTLPKATPYYLPAKEPEFASVGTEIEQAVTGYRPLSEGVVVIVTRRDEVFVARLRLSDSSTVGTRMN